MTKIAVWASAVFIAALNGYGRDKPPELLPGPGLKQVEAFQRPAYFVGKDSHLNVLEVTQPREPSAVFEIFKFSDNVLRVLPGQIVPVPGGGGVFVSNGETIFHVTTSGDVKNTISPFELMDEEYHIGNYDINWYLGASAKNSFLYFVLLSKGKNPKTDFVCRLDLATKQVQMLEFSYPARIDVDLETGIVYVPHESGNTGIRVKDFDGKIDKRIRTGRYYSSCKLSAARDSLLLSTFDLDLNRLITILDLNTEKEVVLPFSGSNATWGSENTIYFVRGENSLWRFKLGDDAPERLFLVREARDSKDGINATTPVLSADGTWLAWGWGEKGVEDPSLGTILIDLDRNEYRTLDRTWTNVQWLTQ